MKRKATAQWAGNLKEGKGQISTQGGALRNTPYSFGTRFEEAPGTNPEELIAAAHAGCFTMAFSNMLSGAGFVPKSVETQAVVEMDMPTLTITNVFLETTGDVPGITLEKFLEIAEEAKKNCPISRLLNAKIGLNANLK